MESINAHIQRLQILKLAFSKKLESKRKCVNYDIIQEYIDELEEQIKKYKEVC
jgi:hypothetical protein